MVEHGTSFASFFEGPLMDIAGYQFRRPELFELASGRKNVRRVAAKRHDERLEFLGDRVLGLAISEYLYGHYPDESEGDMARRFAVLVSGKTCSRVAQNWEIIDTSKYSHRQRAAWCEAVIGAIYCDGGYSLARDFVLSQWQEQFEDQTAVPIDSKTRLQEWSARRGLGLPLYRESARRGGDHNPLFTFEVIVGDAHRAQGRGRTRKDAEQAAARVLLATIEASIK